MNPLRYLFFAAGLILCSCQGMEPVSARPKDPRVTIRISDDYRRGDVASYEVYEWPVFQHCMALVTLKSGRTLPMLCRKYSGTIYPIDQSVFATADPTRFVIMCVPLFGQRGTPVYPTMPISVVIDSQGPSDGSLRHASKILPKPGLIARPGLNQEAESGRRQVLTPTPHTPQSYGFDAGHAGWLVRLDVVAAAAEAL